MMRSRLTGPPSFDSSFQSVLRSTPSSLGAFHSSMAALARLTTSPRLSDWLTTASQRASGGTKKLVLVAVGLGGGGRDAGGDGARDLLGEAVGRAA